MFGFGFGAKGLGLRVNGDGLGFHTDLEGSLGRLGLAEGQG